MRLAGALFYHLHLLFSTYKRIHVQIQNHFINYAVYVAIYYNIDINCDISEHYSKMSCLCAALTAHES